MGNVKKSPWLLHYDGSSCNGCDIEVLASLTPIYDAERFGVINTGDPLQADIFLVTGGINHQCQGVVKQLYDQMPNPKVVVAVGICACTGGIFKETYNILGGVDTTIPVDVYVPGCAARPQAIIDGIVKGIDLFQRRSDERDRLIKDAKKNGKVTDEVMAEIDARINQIKVDPSVKAPEDAGKIKEIPTGGSEE